MLVYFFCTSVTIVVVPVVLTVTHLIVFKVHGTPFEIDCSEGEFSEYDEKGECPVAVGNLQSTFKVVIRHLHYVISNTIRFIYIVFAIPP